MSTSALWLPADSHLITGDALNGFRILSLEELKPGDRLSWLPGFQPVVKAIEEVTYSGEAFEIRTNHVHKNSLFSEFSDEDDREAPGFIVTAYGGARICRIDQDSISKKNSYHVGPLSSLSSGANLISMPLNVCCKPDLTVPVTSLTGERRQYYAVKTASVVETKYSNAKCIKVTFEDSAPVIVNGITLLPERIN